jgi:GDP-D-mannose dehydratase
MISYAKNFKDVLPWFVLKKAKNSFYLDVGAGDSTQESVTKSFYNLGWVGIDIQPNAQDLLADTFRQLGLDWRKHMVPNPKVFCPSDIEGSSGNGAKVRRKLGWKLQIRFPQMIRLLVEMQAQRPDLKPLLGSL